MAKTSVYWLRPGKTKEFSSKKALLEKLDYAVEDFESPDELYQRVKSKRATIIVITPWGNNEEEMLQYKILLTP